MLVAMSDLVSKRSVAGAKAVDASSREKLSKEVPEWKVAADGKSITRRYEFENYYRTLAFVNAVAFVAHAEDHHPDLEVKYGSVNVLFSTHDAGGITENDFICAAKCDALFAQGSR
jgi:4a-hydroxytetrahydrobiopterin dehydratase